MKILKQLFCKHVWKEVNSELLWSRTIRIIKMLSFSTMDVKEYNEIKNHYAIGYRCIKCGKIKIEEEIRYKKV